MDIRRRKRFKCYRCGRVFAIGEAFRICKFKNAFSAFACFDKEKCDRRIERNLSKAH